ncbi:MAG: rhodanese-like domain-containing protein [Actinomycetia bacterium]|nr:rhodanese-like domain-containing protein [Actinomycetes bacterium]
MSSEIPEVDVAEAARRQLSGAPLIDVREPDEWAEVHASGAILVPLSEIENRVGDDLRREDELLMICRSGGRSMRAAEFLMAQGFSCVNVGGGTLAWTEAGLPTESGS